MSIIDNAVKANRDHARKHDPKLVFDMATGLLSEVQTLSPQTAA
jgi:hypothetical protein